MNSKKIQQITLLFSGLLLGWLALSSKADAATYYVAQAGDTLDKIAQEAGIDVNKLASDNNLVTSRHLEAGQKLLISTQTNGRSTTTSAQTSTTNQTSDDVQAALTTLGNQVGKTLYNGQCYGLTAWYVDQLKGPTMMGSGHEYAQNIGEDYDWAAYGWTVTEYPTIDQIHPGDVICWEAGGSLSPGIYGHTGVVKSIDSNGNMVTYEQNAGAGQIAYQYNRTYNQTRIKSVIHKNGSTTTTNTTTSNPSDGLATNDAQAKEWIAQRESSGSYTAQNGQYYGRYQLNLSYLNGDLSPANQEITANRYVQNRYGSWTAAQQFWQVNGWY